MMKTASIWALTLLLAGCGGEGASAASGETPEVAPVPPPAAREREAEPGPRVDEPSFELVATATGPYRAGTAATFEIRLTPRGSYHVNQEYPMSVTLSGPDAISWPRPELGNEDAAERTLQRARFEVPFTAASPGEHRVTADVDFAVCTPETCMPDRRTLALVLRVE